MKLNRPWTGPWEVIKRLGEVVYRIKYRGAVRNYAGVKRRIVHHNQLKPFHGSGNEQSWVADGAGPIGVSRPSSADAGNGSGVIVLDDGVFPSADVGTSSEDPGTEQQPLQAAEPSRRP